MNTGFLLINKPAGPTSHNIISRLRKVTGIKRIGHAGTLDPFASGLLIVAVGRESTKRLGKFLKMDKSYIATLHLGAETDTFDREGKVQNVPLTRGIKGVCQLSNPPIPPCQGGGSLQSVEAVLKSFVGKQKQIPPMFSAKKFKGKKLYELARKGVEIEREPVEIEIYGIKMLEYAYPLLKIEVSCASGTYIRSLAFDIGRKLGIGAYLEELQRTSIAGYRLESAVGIESLDQDNWKNSLSELAE